MSQKSKVAESQDRVGELVAAHRLAKDCLILLGWTAEPMAEEGIAFLEARRHEKGRFRAASWPDERPEARTNSWFVAAVRVNGIADVDPGEQLRLHGAGARVPTIACLPPEFLDASAFVAELGLCFGERLGAAANFFLETLGNKALRGVEPVSGFLTSLLDSIAREDGVVEVIGPLAGEGILLQGWARNIRPGEAALALVAGTLEGRTGFTASFSRTDVETPASGFVTLVQHADGISPGSLERVFLRDKSGWRRLAVLPDALRLNPDEAPNHLRDLLPRLRMDAAVTRNFRAAVRPRFGGEDTVSSLDRPIRMAIDLVIRLPGAGYYLTGWLLDPAGLVGMATLRGSSSLAERLDSRWTRVPRADVSDGFRSDPLFQDRIRNDLHGFTVFIPGPTAADERVWLELDVAGGMVAFMPLYPYAGDTPENRRRILESFDIHKPSAGAIVEQHVGPLFHALKRTPKREIAFAPIRQAPETPGATGVIIPLVDPATPINVVVSQFASEKSAGLRLVFVCSATIGDAGIKTLIELLSFYGIDADVIAALEPVDPCQALEIGVRATTVERLIFLAPTVYGSAPGWLAGLAAALPAGDTQRAMSPTLLYEDWSIKHAGIETVAMLETAPYASAASRHAGYSRHWAAANAPQASLAAAIECSVLSRAAFESVGGFSEGYALVGLKGLDFFLRLRRAGIAIEWNPAIEAYALDDPNSSHEYWTKTGEMADGWSFQRSWRTSLPPLTDAPAADAAHRAIPRSAKPFAGRTSGSAAASHLRADGNTSTLPS